MNTNETATISVSVDSCCCTRHMVTRGGMLSESRSPMCAGTTPTTCIKIKRYLCSNTLFYICIGGGVRKLAGDFGGLLPDADGEKRPRRGPRKISLQVGARCRRSRSPTRPALDHRALHVLGGCLRCGRCSDCLQRFSHTSGTH